MTNTAAASSSSSETKTLTLSEVFAKVSTNLLHELLDGNRIKHKRTGKKAELADLVVSSGLKNGTAHLVDTMDKELLKEVNVALGGDAKVSDKVKLRKHIKDSIESAKTLEAFFEKFEKSVLTKFCKTLGFEDDADKKEDIIVALIEETLILGTRHLLDKMTKDVVSEIASSAGTKTSGSKSSVITHIIGAAYPNVIADEKEEEEEKKKRKAEGGDDKSAEKPSVPKVPIAKGVTAEQLYQYYLAELKEYCKTNGLKTSGNRKELIKRILTFLSGAAATGIKKGEKKAAKKRPMSEAAKKKKAKEAKAKKAAAAGGAAPAAAPAAASSEPAKKKAKK